MKIKVDVQTVSRIIDARFPIEKLYKQLNSVTGKTGMIFGEPSVGAGMLQWKLDGEGWTSFSDLDDSAKPRAATIFNERKRNVEEALHGSSLAEAVLSVPDEKYIYFRNQDSVPEVALVCWGYRYPYLKNGAELETWISKVDLQQVNISFSWSGNKLPNYPFRFNSQPRYTGLDGVFPVDQPLPVGNTYNLVSESGQVYPLTVVKDQSDYDYDLTKYFSVDVYVEKDSLPAGDVEVTVTFSGKNELLKTDSTGHSTLRIPLECDAKGEIKEIQGYCIVTCDDQVISKTPADADDVLEYKFEFVRPADEEEVDVVPPPPPPPEPEPDPEPKVPEFVGITILDYEGYPVKEMNVTLVFPSKREETFMTDENGRIEFPKDWMSQKGRIRVKFTATPAYQEKHDLHIVKSKK